MPPEDAVLSACTQELSGLAELDNDVFDYIVSLLGDSEDPSKAFAVEGLTETISPFLSSCGFVEMEEEAKEVVERLSKALMMNVGLYEEFATGIGICPDRTPEVCNPDSDDASRPVLLQKMVRMGDKVDDSEDKEQMGFLWGTGKHKKLYNETMDWDKALSKKAQRRAEKEQQQFLKELEALTGGIEDDGEEDLSLAVLPDYTMGRNEKDIRVQAFDLDIVGKPLLEGTDLKLSFNHRYGLVGKNGVGKTTLLLRMASYDIAGFPRHHRVLHVKQEIKASQRVVLDVVVACDVERARLLVEEKTISDRINLRAEAKTTTDQESWPSLEEDTQRLLEVHDRFSAIGAHSAESRAGAILHGLGFSDSQMNGVTADLSGGWRMRVSIAGALFTCPDLLLLDEPTNHLDLNAVIWLAEYLKSYPKTVVVVSHDRAFLNEVATDIISMHDFKLHYYKGNFNIFESVRSEQLKNQKRAFEAEKAKREHMQEFVDKFRCNAKRASLVQSRIKALDKMEEVEDVIEEEKFRFSLPEPTAIGSPILLQIESVSFGYDLTRDLVLSDVDFSIDIKTRIGILGSNGAGKSTLLNIILDKLNPVSGIVKRNSHLRMASFTQHHAEQCDYRKTAIENMMARFVGSQEQEIRSFLGRFHLSGALATRPMKFLSGGQKSRYAFACLAYSQPHIIVLDEPTNHLDTETIDALVDASQAFKGGLICVSHDQYFINSVCEELYVINGGTCKKFNGAFNDYKDKCILSNRTSGMCSNMKS
eukprot:16962_1